MHYQRERLDLWFVENFLDEEESDSTYDTLMQEVEWMTPLSKLGNKRTHQNYGDEGITYTLSFKDKTFTRGVKPWLPCLVPIREKLSELTDKKYAYCVVQIYKTGKIGISPHRDKEMLPTSSICGISLGATRTLTMSPPYYNKRDKESLKFELNKGSLYLMNPPTNSYWSHCIEKDDKITEPRISLTFRSL